MLDFVLQRKHYGVAKMLIRKTAAKPDEVLESVAATGNAELVQASLDAGKPSQAGAHEPAPAFVVDVKTLEAYAGTYKSDQVPLDIKVFVKEGSLYMQATGQPEFALKATSATQFEFTLAQVVVEFDSASSFTLKQGGGSFRFKKAVTQ